ncbi:hypothetical protein [Rufibacter sp. XAAS-G3-1]|uniref:hypothetical protein n=1 Tax=Rufibacter sp. XAAS-G3-1 TaxID=2729134 RepID=UPI0015E6EE03|nr:hypothetical protein [Rufibacter sp. XAAS-G3-1]
METLNRKWSAAAKERNRRKRAARRIYSKFPLLAVPLMRDLEEGGNGGFRYLDYSYTQLEIDLKRKTAAKKRKGKNPSPTFKQYLLKKWQGEIFWQLRQNELVQNLISKYYLLLNSPGRYVKFKVTFKCNSYTFNFPDNANEETAKAMLDFVNQQIKVCSDFPELEKEINNYRKRHFSSFGN